MRPRNEKRNGVKGRQRGLTEIGCERTSTSIGSKGMLIRTSPSLVGHGRVPDAQGRAPTEDAGGLHLLLHRTFVTRGCKMSSGKRHRRSGAVTPYVNQRSHPFLSQGGEDVGHQLAGCRRGVDGYSAEGREAH